LTYTQKEARYFYWHCMTVATLLENLDLNTATSVHVNKGIRMATLNAVGRLGISLASPSAAKKIASSTGPGSYKGLLREHVVPVSVISTHVLQAWRSTERPSWRELLPWLNKEDCRHWEVVDSDYFLEVTAPLSALVATIVRRKTLLAWVTSADNLELRSRGLIKRMPDSSTDDPRARYTACGISLVDLRELAAT
jgi:hypothetical protein